MKGAMPHPREAAAARVRPPSVHDCFAALNEPLAPYSVPATALLNSS